MRMNQTDVTEAHIPLLLHDGSVRSVKHPYSALCVGILQGSHESETETEA